MHNDSGTDVIPSDGNTVSFEAYWYDGNTKVTITRLAWDNAVIPAGKENLVYFKWTVPENIAGKKVYAEAVMNAAQTVSETGYENNVGRLVKTVATIPYSITPETRYERQAPDGFVKPVLGPAPVPGYATWEIWEYVNGSFVKRYYGIELKSVSPELEPDPDDPSATVSNGRITMKSGYGFYLKYVPEFKAVSGRIMPDDSAYTYPQTAYATFPEFGYAATAGRYKTLERLSGRWYFGQDFSVEDSERLHFTPLWYPDGDYTVSVTVSDIWTPAGMITASGSAPTITISGSAYDDWYLGR